MNYSNYIAYSYCAIWLVYVVLGLPGYGTFIIIIVGCTFVIVVIICCVMYPVVSGSSAAASAALAPAATASPITVFSRPAVHTRFNPSQSYFRGYRPGLL